MPHLGPQSSALRQKRVKYVPEPLRVKARKLKFAFKSDYTEPAETTRVQRKNDGGPDPSTCMGNREVGGLKEH